MARKPVHLTEAGGKPQGRQAIWEAIRRLKEFTARALVFGTDIHPRTITAYLAGLEAAAYLERITGGSIGTATYRLIRDTGIEAPRVTGDGRPVIQGAARAAMWRSMKMLRGEFTAPDLAVAASTEETPVAETDARDYCKHLAAAGYLQVMRKGLPGAKKGQGNRYRFVPARDTGPKAPMVQRVKTVWDPNERRIVWNAGVKDE